MGKRRTEKYRKFRKQTKKKQSQMRKSKLLNFYS